MSRREELINAVIDLFGYDESWTDEELESMYSMMLENQYSGSTSTISEAKQLITSSGGTVMGDVVTASSSSEFIQKATIVKELGGSDAIPDVVPDEVITKHVSNDTEVQSTRNEEEAPDMVDESGSSDDEMLKIIALCDLTGAEFEDAKAILQRNNWDMERASNTHFSRIGSRTDLSNPPVLSNISTTTFTSSSSSTEGLPIVPPGFNSLFPPNFFPIGQQPPDFRYHNVNGPTGFDLSQGDSHSDSDFEDNQESQENQMIGDDGFDYSQYMDPKDRPVRKPDKARVQVLAGSSRSGTFSSSRWNERMGADEFGVEWISKCPVYPTSMQSFEDAKKHSLASSRWLLVFISMHSSFDSTIIHRDVLADSSLDSIIDACFTIWCRGHTSLDAKEFIANYQVSEDSLPGFFIIEPRTGMLRKDISNKLSKAKTNALKLYEALSDFSMENTVQAMTRASSSSDMETDPDKEMDSDRLAADSSDSSSYSYSNNSSSASSNVSSSISNSNIINNNNSSSNSSSSNNNSSSALSVNSPLPIDYGEVPPEPESGSPDNIKVSLRIMSSKKVSLSRYFYSKDEVRSLFAWAKDACEKSGISEFGSDFELLFGYPQRGLSMQLNDRLSGISDLNNSLLTMRKK